MLALTRSERRAAMVVVFLLLLGAARDLWCSRHPRLNATREPTGATRDAGRAARGAPFPRIDSEATAPAVADRTPGPGSGTLAGPIDLNHAGPVELDALPGVGPVLAARIVEQRKRHGPFRDVEELLAVRGIGPRLLERLRPLVVVKSEPP